MIVIKFGGTSIGDVEARARAAAIVSACLHRRPVVVVSALSGVTNALLELAALAAAGNREAVEQSLERLHSRHMLAAGAIAFKGANIDAVVVGLASLHRELSGLVAAIGVLGHLTPRLLDAVASFGERFSVPLLVAVLRHHEVPAAAVDATRVIITDDRFTAASPDAEAIERAATRILLPLLDAGVVPVVGGFVGCTTGGAITTLGRGGSDYTAALLGAALRASAIEIWTDVDGMLTADPRLVPDARPIELLRSDEASELAAFGAKVLHPASIAPAVAHGIPVGIFNSFHPERPGTWITADAPCRAVTAIAGRSGVTIVRVRTSRMLFACGFLRRFFEIFERHGTSVDVIATSEVSVSVTLDDASDIEALAADLSALGDVEVRRDHALIAVVGTAFGGESGTMARALAALSGMHVPLVSVSATAINLTLVVDAAQMGAAMRSLHAEFFGVPSIEAGSDLTPESSSFPELSIQ